MILYIENSKVSTRKNKTKQNKTKWEIIKEFSKVAGYKINMHKPIAFLYTKNKLAERESKKIIPFKTVSKRIN